MERRLIFPLPLWIEFEMTSEIKKIVGVLLLGLRHGEILEDKKSFIVFFFLCSAALALEKHLQISFPPLGMFF